MTERSVFLEALEYTDPAARAAYLERACAGRPAFRQRVEELLRSHEEAGTFLDVPALEQMAAGDRSLAFLAPAREPDALGRLDHYEVLEVVGRGGTGVVLKARDTKLQRIVAIKALAPRFVASPAARARFVREAQAAAAVRDDHVVAIHAVHDDGPVPYLVMEFISGMTLEDRLRQDKALELKEVLRIGMQIAAGLAGAHAQGLAHRDIKPANILLENSVQRVKITDFGLARLAEDSPPGAGKLLAGTPLYMSPEQARGEASDYRTDLFSLGSVLYTLCARRPPFPAETVPEILKRVCEDEPAPLRDFSADVPAWLCQAIGKLHAKRPGDRFGSAREVADLLSAELARLQQAAHLQSQEDRKSRNQGNEERRVPLGLSSRPLVALAALLAGLLFALGAVALWFKPWRPGASEQPPTNVMPGPATPPAQPLELRREDIPPLQLAVAGGGDPAQAPPELVAVLGGSRFILPRRGQAAWMDQSPDGKVLAVPLDEDVVLFDAQTGRCLRTLQGPGGRVFYVCFSRDSQLLAATTRRGQAGGAVRVWDLGADRVLHTNPHPGGTISCAAAFSGDGKRLVTEVDGRIHVCDARSGALIQEAEVGGGGIGSLCFSPDGHQLAVGNWQANRVKIFAWAGEKLKEVHTLGHLSPVTSAVYSPDGKWLASGDGKEFKVWNAETFEELFTVQRPAEQLAFAPDGGTLVAAATTMGPSRVHTFTRWDVATHQPLSALSAEVSVEPVRAFHCLGRDGKTLFVVQQHGATFIPAIDTGTGKERFPHQGHAAPLNAVAVSPDGRRLASAGEDYAVKVWDLAGGRLLHSLTAHKDDVCGLVFSPDGKLLASASQDGSIGLWDLDRGSEMRALHWHSRSPSRLRFSPDGRHLVVGSDRGVVQTWEVGTGQKRADRPGHAGVVRCVAFSPDGKHLASGGEDKTVCVHEVAGRLVRKFTAPHGINDVAFSGDGQIIAAVGDGPAGAVHLWRVESSQETILEGHAGRVHGVAFAPAAPLLATCGEDGTVRLWDVSRPDAALVRSVGPGPFGGPVGGVAFTPDGRYLLTANANGTVYVLRIGGGTP
jgi:WD40 repeat protein/serine/threonine protein kinase